MLFIPQAHLGRSCTALLVVWLFINPATGQSLQEKAVVNASSVTIVEPCEKMKNCAMMVSGFVTTSQYQSALMQLQQKAKSDPLHEYIVSFGRDTQGQVMTSPISSGNRTNAVVPFVENGFADLHNHPGNTPPSSGDLYSLLMKNKRNGQYTARYILTSGSLVYALVIVDTAASRNFLSIYPPQKTPGYSPLFPDEILNEYRENQQRFGASEELAMAYLLEKYATGVILLKQSNLDSFEVIRASVSGEGDSTVFISAACR